MALNGRAGHRFSQAPQPIQRSVVTIGICGEFSLSGSEGIMSIAPAGQCRAQFLHSTPSVNTTQFSLTQTAWPICIADLSAAVIFLIAPAGHTSEHLVHSGRQYPLSYETSGCISVSIPVEGLNTPLGHTDTYSWQPVQCEAMLLRLCAPGGTIGVSLSGIFLSSIAASPPSTIFFLRFQ